MKHLRKLAPILMVLVFFAGCAKSGSATKPLPPGATSAFDATSYDSLRTIQGAIDGFKQAGVPAAAKKPLNELIVAYNAAQTAWQAYHAGTGSEAQVTSAISNAQAKLAAVQAAGGK